MSVESDFLFAIGFDFLFINLAQASVPRPNCAGSRRLLRENMPFGIHT